MKQSEEMRVAIQAAKKAGDVLLSFYSREYSVAEKENKTPVTEADLASQKIIRETLLKDFDYPILSEEAVDDTRRLDSEYVWVVDPLDGTANFIEKTGEFTVVIALCRNNIPVLGVVYRPTTQELYFAERGYGAYLEEKDKEPKKINVSRQQEFAQLRLTISNHPKPLDLQVIERANIKNITRVGSLALKGCLIAEGKHDAYFSFDLNWENSEWDTCAVSLIVEEAGGTVTNIFGEPLVFNQLDVRSKKGIVIDNGSLHVDLILHLSSVTSDQGNP